MSHATTLKKHSNACISVIFGFIILSSFTSNTALAQGNTCPEVLIVNEILPDPIGYVIENEQGQIVASAPLGQLPSTCNLVVGQRYKLTPFRPGHDMDSVTTFDLIMINRYLIGSLTNGYTFSQRYASDVNQSMHVSVSDMVLLKDFILHPYTELSQTPTWTFFPKEVADANSAMPFNAENLFFTYSGPDQELEFKSVKMGRSREENKYYDTNFPRVGTLYFDVADIELNEGKTYTIPFQSNDYTQIIGYQLALQLDPQGLELIEWLPGLHGHLTDVGLDQPIEGLMTTSYMKNFLALPANQSLPDGEVFFTIKLKARANGKLSQFLSINRAAMLSEAYNRQDEFLDVALNFKSPYIGLGEDVVDADAPGFPFQGEQTELRSMESSSGTTLVFQPNPFRSDLQIGFWQAQPGETIIRIVDLAGRDVFVQKGFYEAGYQQLVWNAGSQLAPGQYMAAVMQKGEVHTMRLVKH